MNWYQAMSFARYEARRAQRKMYVYAIRLTEGWFYAVSPIKPRSLR